MDLAQILAEKYIFNQRQGRIVSTPDEFYIMLLGRFYVLQFLFIFKIHPRIKALHSLHFFNILILNFLKF